LERGLIDIAKSDKPKARKNLLRAIQIDEKSPVAEQARAAIEAMDVKSRK
jgi:Tfp pilus assembly protein PilF